MPVLADTRNIGQVKENNKVEDTEQGPTLDQRDIRKGHRPGTDAGVRPLSTVLPPWRTSRLANPSYTDGDNVVPSLIHRAGYRPRLYEGAMFTHRQNPHRVKLFKIL